nr:neutrophil gelatinase-associated lipocalin-like [Cavia porcellus]
MNLGLLCVALILTLALKIQAKDSASASIPNPPLRKFPLHPDFQYNQFQGKWYAVGSAQNRVSNKGQREVFLQSTIFKLNKDHSYNVISKWFSKQQCVYKIGMIFPTNQSGLFSLENIARYGELYNFTLRVLETDYNQFAMVVRKIVIYDTVYFEHILYGRTKELSPELKQHYHNVSSSLGLTDDHITFTDPRDIVTMEAFRLWASLGTSLLDDQ